LARTAEKRQRLAAFADLTLRTLREMDSS